MNSGSAISVAVGEVVEKTAGNTGPPSLALDRSKPILSNTTTNTTSSSNTNSNNTNNSKIVNTPPPAAPITTTTTPTTTIQSTNTTTNTNTNTNTNSNKEIMEMLTKYHKEQTQTMTQLATLVIDISGRLTVLEYKLEDHMNMNMKVKE